MPVPLLSIKLVCPPQRARLVARPRLIQTLTRAASAGFVLVSAPAGYGKSTLVSAWLAQNGSPCAWLSLDETDNDLLRFLAYLAAALDQADPGAGAALETMLPLSPLPAAETLLTPLVNRLLQSHRSFWLVLDDYHVIHNQDIHQVIAFLLEHRPPAFHLVLCTRADPPLPLSRLRARAQVVELRMADLRFTLVEAQEFLGQVLGVALVAEDLAELEASTEGWPAGLQMAGLSLLGREAPAAFIRSFRSGNRYILDFLFEEVFQRQEPALQEFLLHTSMLERLCGSLCDALLQRSDSQAVLEALDARNLFLIALDENGQWYRYHPLFRGLLGLRLEQVAPELAAPLHRRACDWFAARQDLQNAMHHALAASDFERAAGLLEASLHALDMQNQQAQLAAWIQLLPQHTLEHHPWLCVLRAWGDYWAGRRGQEETWLRLAEDFLARNTGLDAAQTERIRGHIAAVRAETAIVDEDVERMRAMAYDALQLLPEDDELRCQIAVALGAAHWALGDAAQSERSFLLAHTPVLVARYPTMVVGPLCYVGYQQARQGRLDQALATYTAALRLACLPGGQETPIAGFPNIKLGDLWREWNELAQALPYLLRGVEQCVRFTQPDALSEAYVCLARYQLAQGDFSAAGESLEQARRVSQKTRVDPFVCTWLDECRLQLWLAQGDLETAVRWAQGSGLDPLGDLNYLHDLPQQNLARVWVAQAAAEDDETVRAAARSMLQRLLAAVQRAGWVQVQIKLLVLLALNEPPSALEESALPALYEAVRLAEPGGFVRVFLDEGLPARSLLAALQTWLPAEGQADRTPRTLRSLSRLLAAFDGHAAVGPPQAALEALVEPLSAREIEVLNLVAQGYSDKEIALRLVISPLTVHKHLNNLYGKLEVHSRTQAVARARALNLA